MCGRSTAACASPALTCGAWGLEQHRLAASQVCGRALAVGLQVEPRDAGTLRLVFSGCLSLFHSAPPSPQPHPQCTIQTISSCTFSFLGQSKVRQHCCTKPGLPVSPSHQRSVLDGGSGLGQRQSALPVAVTHRTLAIRGGTVVPLGAIEGCRWHNNDLPAVPGAARAVGKLETMTNSLWISW